MEPRPLQSALRRLLVLAPHGTEQSPEDFHSYIAFDAMLLSYTLILLVVMACLAEKLKLPASSAAILIGAAIGGFFRLGRVHESEYLVDASFITFDEELFLYILLPPIIFEAGYSLSKGHFFGNLGTILLFAVVGTLCSTFVIGQSCYIAGKTGVFKSESGRHDVLDFGTPLDSFLFGALISATDPVATLSIMGAVNADPLVYTLVFGESVLNDAVAIVLVRILSSMGRVGFSDPSAYVIGIGQFFGVSLGSLAVGLLVSAVSALLLKRFDMRHHPSLELSLVLLFGYSAYTTAEAAGCSGILALFSTGVLAGHYHVHSLSDAAREACGVTLKAFAHLSETAVFAYMGVDLFAITGAGLDAYYHAHHHVTNATGASGASDALAADPELALPDIEAPDLFLGEPIHSPRVGWFCVYALLVVLLARVLVVLPLCILANWFRSRRRQLSRRAMAMLIFSGLRGAIAFALAHNIESEHQTTIAAATTTVVLFTTFVLGGLTRSVIRLLKMEANELEGGDHRSILANDEQRSDNCDGVDADASAQRISGADMKGEILPDALVEQSMPGNGDERSESGRNHGDKHGSCSRAEQMQPRAAPPQLGAGGRLERLFVRIDETALKPVFGGPAQARGPVPAHPESRTGSGTEMPISREMPTSHASSATVPALQPAVEL